MTSDSITAACIFALLGIALVPALAWMDNASAMASKSAAASDTAVLPLVVIVTTGGSIAEKIDPKTGGAVPTVSGADLVAAVPHLKQVARIEVRDFSNIDSSQMAPEVWARLSRTVDAELARSEVRGVVVTHGSDTMSEGAYFLDLTLKSHKPVVFTGAMDDASSPFPDGPGNLLDAVVQVCSPQAAEWGVTVTLNRYVNSARAVSKTQTTNVQTFLSGEYGFLGYVFGRSVKRFNARPPRKTLPLPEKLPKVTYLATYAGDDGSLVRHAVDDGADGLIIDGVGAGNVNAATYDAILYALSKNLPVGIASRVNYGAVEPIYSDKGGAKRLQDKGCILTGDLGGPKARLLLILGIATHGTDREKLQALFTD